MINIMMDDETGNPCFTFALEHAPRNGDRVRWSDRWWYVLSCEWRPHDPFPLRLIVKEEKTRTRR